MAKFMRKGKTKVYFVPTITTLTAPTVAQITAGQNLTAMISEINGFTFQNNPINVPDMSTAFVSKINGEDTVEDSSLVLYEDDTTHTVQTALAKGTAGYIVFFYKGTAGANPAINDKCETWPVVVASNARQYTADNEAAKHQVVFTTTAAPVEGTLA